ncbi:hypothetical protein ACHAXT_010898 [Thalassiosira profunda]
MAEIDYRVVWQKDDEVAKSDARQLWRELNLLPQGTEDDRANSLCVVAYAPHDDGTEELIAVSTIGLQRFPQVRARLAFFRCLVKPDYRQKNLATELAIRCKIAMEEWSILNLDEKVMGFATIVESPHLMKKALLPVWPKTGLAVAGYTPRGQQIRLVWFAHAKFDVPLSEAEQRKKAMETDATVWEN